MQKFLNRGSYIKISATAVLALALVFSSGAFALDPTDGSDAKTDSDHDGLTNADEFNYATDPNNPDTDSDGPTDGWEVHFRNVWYERELDAQAKNIFGDLYKNLDAEKQRQVRVAISSEWNLFPLNPTDGNDAGKIPVEKISEAKNNPSVLYGWRDADAQKYLNDPDGDGWNNLHEFLAGTDPTNPDTDGDKINDAEDPNPLIPDTSGSTNDGGQGSGQGGDGQKQKTGRGQFQGPGMGGQNQGQGMGQGQNQGNGNGQGSGNGNGQNGQGQGQSQGQGQGSGQGQNGNGNGQGNGQSGQGQGQQQGNGQGQQQGQGQGSGQSQGQGEGQGQNGNQNGGQGSQQQGQGQGQSQSQGNGNGQNNQGQNGNTNLLPTRIIIDSSDVGFNSPNKAITKGQPFAIKGHVEYRDPATGMWQLIGSLMDIEGYVKLDGQSYKIGSARADLDSNGNAGVGYFNLIATVPADAPAGEGILSVKAIANNIYAGSEISESPVSGAPKKNDTKNKVLIKNSKAMSAKVIAKPTKAKSKSLR